MKIDPWKACTVVLGGVFCLVVAGGAVESAAAQSKAPQKIPSGSAPAPAPVPDGPKQGPVKIVGTPAPEEPGPSEGGGEGDNKKGTPAERAVKLMEAARAKVTKLKPDAEGRRERTLKHIDQAISETRAIPATKE
jgi:hypothetical protein